MSSKPLMKLAPLVFVVLWSTGFIGSKYAVPYAEPFTILALRMYISLLMFLLLIAHYRTKWPGWRGAKHSMVVGAMVHGAYLGGVFAAIKAGMPAGIASLLVGLQPILTALFLWLGWGQRISVTQILGLLMGLAGVFLVLIYGKPGAADLYFSTDALLFSLMALLGITCGTLYQKHFCQDVELLTGTFYQYLSTALIMTLAALVFETREIDWQLPFVLAVLWLVFGLSLTAILLLMRLIKEGEATKVASYFYLTPAVTALMAWGLFGETVNETGMIGIGLTACGVYLVIRNPALLFRRTERR